MYKKINPNEVMLNSIIFSIKPFYSELILSGEKCFEFRNFKPKNFSSYFWVYESSPTKKLKYLMEVEEPIVFPNTLNGNSYGVERFNNGSMQCKYAYPIKRIFMLENPIEYLELKTSYNFTAPQAYTYLSNNLKLQNRIKKSSLMIK